MKLRPQGIIPPLLTPLNENLTLDEPGLEKLLEHILIGGAEGIFILGTTGEGVNFDLEFKKNMIATTCKMMAGKLPVYVCVTDTSYQQQLRLAEIAADSGASALVAGVPNYYRLSQVEIFTYFEKLATASTLPLIVYDIPETCHHELSQELLLKASRLPNVRAIKDSSLNMIKFHYLVDQANIPVLIGPELLLIEGLLMGAAGGVPGGANFLPKLFTEIYDSSSAKDYGKLKLLQRMLNLIRECVYEASESSYNYIQGLKYVLSKKGIIQPFLMPPLRNLNKIEQSILDQRLTRLEKITENYF